MKNNTKLAILSIVSISMIAAFQNCSDAHFANIEPRLKFTKDAPVLKGISAPGQLFVEDYWTLHGSNKKMTMVVVQTIKYSELVLEIKPVNASALWNSCIIGYQKTAEEILQDEISVEVDCWMPSSEIIVEVKGKNSNGNYDVQPESKKIHLSSIIIDAFKYASRAISPKEWMWPVRTFTIQINNELAQRAAFNHLAISVISQRDNFKECEIQYNGVEQNDGWRFPIYLRFNDDGFQLDCNLKEGEDYRIEFIGSLDGQVVHRDINYFEVREPGFVIDHIKVVTSDNSQSADVYHGDVYSILNGSNKRLELYITSSNPEGKFRLGNVDYGMLIQFTYSAVSCVYKSSFKSNPMYDLVSTKLDDQHYRISIPYSAISFNCHDGLDAYAKGLLPIDASLTRAGAYGESADHISAKQFWYYHGYQNVISPLSEEN